MSLTHPLYFRRPGFEPRVGFVWVKKLFYNFDCMKHVLKKLCS